MHGTISDLSLTVTYAYSCVNPAGDCGSGPQKMSGILRSAQALGDFTFSGDAKVGSHEHLNIKGTFVSSSSISGTYSASYSHSFYFQSGSGSGSWTATKQ